MQQTKRLNIAEFAKLCGVTPRTLKYYEQLGLFSPEKVGENGYREYSIGQIDEVSAIRLFREHGLSLREIGEIIAGDDVESVRRCLRRQQEVLAERTEALRRQQYFVEHTLRLTDAAIAHMDEPFLEHGQTMRLTTQPPDTRMINYLLRGFENGAVLDAETYGLKETYRLSEDGEVQLSGSFATLYCMGAPAQCAEGLGRLRRLARQEGILTDEIFCSEILERAGGGQGLFRYIIAEKRS